MYNLHQALKQEIHCCRYWIQTLCSPNRCVSAQFQGLLRNRDEALTEITQRKALFAPTREQARHRSDSLRKHAPYIYETLTGACVHDRQFHYSQSGWKVGERSIRGGWRHKDRDSDKKNSPCSSVVLTLPQREVFLELQMNVPWPQANLVASVENICLQRHVIQLSGRWTSTHGQTLMCERPQDISSIARGEKWSVWRWNFFL